MRKRIFSLFRPTHFFIASSLISTAELIWAAYRYCKDLGFLKKSNDELRSKLDKMTKEKEENNANEQ